MEERPKWQKDVRCAHKPKVLKYRQKVVSDFLCKQRVVRKEPDGKSYYIRGLYYMSWLYLMKIILLIFQKIDLWMQYYRYSMKIYIF